MMTVIVYDDVNAADTGDDAHPARDVADKKGDNTRDDLDETKTASTNDPKEASGRQNDEAANADQPAKVKDETVASADPASRDEQTIDPNMVAVPSVNPAAPPQTSGSTVTQTATGSRRNNGSACFSKSGAECRGHHRWIDEFHRPVATRSGRNGKICP